MDAIIRIRKEDADLFESLDLIEGIELSKKISKGDFTLVWNALERWWEED